MAGNLQTHPCCASAFRRLFNHTTNRRTSKELNMKSWLKRGTVPTFDIACGVSSGTGSLTLNENQDK